MKPLRRILIAGIFLMLILSTISVANADEAVLVYIDPAETTINNGETFTVAVICDPQTNDVKGFEFRIAFNPSVLQVNSVTEGTIFEGFDTFFNDGTIDNTVGTIIDIYGLTIGVGPGATEVGSLVVISFTSIQSGSSPISLSDVGIVNGGDIPQYLPLVVTDGNAYTGQILTITIVGDGTVTKSPDKPVYNYGEAITLTAIPSSGWLFGSWSENITGTTNPSSVTMNGNKAVTVTFLDAAAPEITGIVRITSNPLDTNPIFGWVKISCTVTDNIEVSTVQIGITPHGGLQVFHVMTSGFEDTYYFNTTSLFSTVGDNTYCIKAVDDEGNTLIDSGHTFVMPPNWDIDMNRVINSVDLVMVATHFGQSGSLGWVREDVDNNGQIKVLDLVTTARHMNDAPW